MNTLNEQNYVRQIGFGPLPYYQGRYFTGASIFTDSVRKLLPLITEKIKQFSRRKVRDFAQNVTTEMDQRQGIRSAPKRSANKTVQNLLKGGKRGRGGIRKKRINKLRTRDFLS